MLQTPFQKEGSQAEKRLTNYRIKPKRPTGLPVSLVAMQEESHSLALSSGLPSLQDGRPDLAVNYRQSSRLTYLALAAFLAGCRSASGLRTSAFVADSSTGVVPCTSFAKVAPAGTR